MTRFQGGGEREDLSLRRERRENLPKDSCSVKNRQAILRP